MDEKNINEDTNNHLLNKQGIVKSYTTDDKPKEVGENTKSILEESLTKTAKFLSQKNILLKKEGVETPVRDPLFAAKVLKKEQEQKEAQAQEKDIDIIELQKEIPEKQSVLRAIRTYKNDVAEALKKNKTSIAQVVLAEQSKRRKAIEEKSPLSKKNIPFFVLSIIFATISIVALLGGSFYFFYDKKNTQVPTVAPKVNSLIFSELQKEIDITDKSKNKITGELTSEISNLNARLDFIENIYFTKQIGASTKSPSLAKTQTIKTLVTTEQFFKAIGSKMPDSLLRSLDRSFTFGIHIFNKNQPFIILKTNFFENTFAGLFRWEDNMARDVLPIFGVTSIDQDLLTKKFKDVVIKNRDMRILLDDNGKTILLYYFFDRHTVVIATAKETIFEVARRLNRLGIK